MALPASSAHQAASAHHPKSGGLDLRASKVTKNTGVRRYERGEHRRKHLGSSERPEIAISTDGEPIGLCPKHLPLDRRQNMLDNAVPHLTRSPYSQAFPKRLYAVDIDGAIYTGQTSNLGASYHGYPYAGPMGKRLIAALREVAQKQNCATEFEKWLKRYVTLGGPPDL